MNYVASAPAAATRDETLAITGMTCAACATRIEKSLHQVPGVGEASVNLALERAQVRFDPARTTTEQLIAAVREAGYDAAPLRADETPRDDKAHVRREATGVILAAALTAPLVIQMILHTAGIMVHLPVWLEAALATPVQFVLGARFYAGSWRALKARSANMDVLVALGTSAAYFYSLALIVEQGSAAAGRLYFEGSAVIITLVLLGKWLEARAKRSTTAAIRALMALRPETARVLRDGEEREIAIADVARGDVVVVRPGEKIPTDGIVADGHSSCDEALITGESLPVHKQPGDTVIAGAINGAGRLIVRTSAVGHDTTLARIVALVQSAQSGKAPMQRLVDRISAVFVPAVLLMAAATFAVWLAAGGGFDHAFVAAVSVLVIACPCALGLATPTALVTGLGAAARAGILVKDIEALERLHAVTTVVFDKTGTLTLGRPAVTKTIVLAGPERENLALAASVQNASEHPLAKAMLNHAKDQGVSPYPVSEFVARLGLGVEGRVNGRHVAVGSVAFAESLGASLNLDPDDDTATPVVLLVDRVPHAVFMIADMPRPQSRAAIAALRAAGFTTWLLSGDRANVALRIGRDLGVDAVRADVKPDDKAREVERLRRQGAVVAMVGDGVNDAPALAAADVGIAMGSGTDVAMATAGITLLRPDPRLVAAAVEIGHATRAKIRENLFWAFVYNLVGVPLAALGFLTPALAGAAMALSSVSVVTNSLRLARWRPRLED
jgi:Cu+-exporting ATPase